MCVIIDKQPGVIFPEVDIEAALENNPDGFGVMWVEDGAVQTMHILDATVLQIMAIQEDLKEFRAVMHFRYVTHGSRSIENVHPFPICTMKEDGIDIFMVHNGTISKVDEVKDESDTRAFIREILYPILRVNPDILHLPSFHKLIDEFIDWSKLVFMTSDDHVIFINKESGSFRHGCWVSNDYSFDSWHRYGSYCSPGYGTTTRKVDAATWGDDETMSHWPAKASGYSSPPKSPEKTWEDDENQITLEQLKYMTDWELSCFLSEEPDLAAKILKDLLYS